MGREIEIDSKVGFCGGIGSFLTLSLQDPNTKRLKRTLIYYCLSLCPPLHEILTFSLWIRENPAQTHTMQIFGEILFVKPPTTLKQQTVKNDEVSMRKKLIFGSSVVACSVLGRLLA